MSSPGSRELLSGHYTPNQGWLTRYLSQPLGGVFAYLAFRLGASPNAVTLTGLGVMLGACLALDAATDPWRCLGAAVLFQLGFALDCADGQLARATGRGSQLGAWLDMACDHIRQLAIVLVLLRLAADNLPGVGAVLVFVFACGVTVYLHTIMALRTPTAQAADPQGGLVRRLSRNLLDTPIFLLLLAALRPWPGVLLLVCGVYGLAQLARSVVLARARLGGAT
mgnify:CR=1 FL=1